MFDSLSDRFDGIFKRLRGKGRLSDSDIDEVLREIRVALLEADVNLSVVRSVVARIREQCLGADLSKSLTPAQQVIKIVNDELVTALGGETLRIAYASKPPTIVLLAGLQGSGKTTASAKLARWFKAQGRNPILVGADLQRPAAVEQLRTLGRQIDVPVFSEPSDPVVVAGAGVAEARRVGRDVVIVDTAGRLHTQTNLMAELAKIRRVIGQRLDGAPHETLLVVDATTGQNGLQQARLFGEAVQVSGVALTKLDGSAKGGIAVAIAHELGLPVKLVGVGESLNDLQPFDAAEFARALVSAD
jgi:signal recognition particle subunit SRP54